MKAEQYSNKGHAQENIDNEQDIDDKEAKLTAFIKSGEDNNDLYEDEEAKEEERQNKTKKVFVVSLAHTGAYPWTVVIKPFNADVAFVAVSCSWRPVDQTCRTEFYF